MVSTRKWATARKTCRPATTCVSGCGACRLRATGTAFHGMAKVIGHWQAVFSLWRPHWITSARSFFEAQPRFATDKMGQNFIFHRIFVCHFAHGRGDYPGFTAQWHKLFSICRNTKRQGDFLVKVKKWKGKKMTAPINMLAILTKKYPIDWPYVPYVLMSKTLVLMSKTLVFMSKREMKVCKLHCTLACARTI